MYTHMYMGMRICMGMYMLYMHIASVHLSNVKCALYMWGTFCYIFI